MIYLLATNWVLATANGTCDEVCSEVGRKCNSERQSTLITNELVAEKMLEAGHICKGYHDCRTYAGAPFSTGRSDDCAPICQGTKSVCNENHAIGDGHRPLCYCEGKMELWLFYSHSNYIQILFFFVVASE